MQVRDIMTPDPVTLHEDDSIDLAEKFMSFAHIRHLPVIDDSARLVGLITHRDLLQAFARERRDLTKARHIMRTDVKTVPLTADLRQAIDTMLDHKYGCLPVVERHRLMGIVTEADFLKLTRSLLSLDPSRNL
jgi:CBS domain-containing membrane protein